MVQSRTDILRSQELERLRNIDRRRRTRQQNARLQALESNITKQERRQRTRDRTGGIEQVFSRSTQRTRRVETSRPETKRETISRLAKSGELKKTDKFTFDDSGNLLILRRDNTQQTQRIQVTPETDEGFLGGTSTFLKRVQTQIRGRQKEFSQQIKQAEKQKGAKATTAQALATAGKFTGGLASAGIGGVQFLTGTARFSESLTRKAGRDKAVSQYKAGKKFILGLDRKELNRLASIAGVSTQIYLKTRTKGQIAGDLAMLAGTVAGFKGVGKVKVFGKRTKIKPKIEKVTLLTKPVSDTTRISKGKFKTVTDYGRAGKLETVTIRKGKSSLSATKGTLKLGSIRLPKVTKRRFRKPKVEFGKPKPLKVSITGRTATVRAGKKKLISFSTQTAKTNKQVIKLTKDELKKANIINPSLTKALARKPSVIKRILRKPSKRIPFGKKPILRRQASITLSQEIGKKRIKGIAKNLDLKKLTDKELKAKFGVTRQQARALGFELDRFSNPINFFKAVQKRRTGILSRELAIKGIKKGKFIRTRAKEVRLDIATRGRTSPIKVGKITVRGAKNTYASQIVSKLSINKKDEIRKLLKLLGVTEKSINKGKAVKALKKKISTIKTEKDLSKLVNMVQKAVKVKPTTRPARPRAIIKQIVKKKAREKATTAQVASSVANANTQKQASSIITQAINDGTITFTQAGFRVGGAGSPVVSLPQGLRGKVTIAQLNSGIVSQKIKSQVVSKLKTMAKSRIKTKAKLKTKPKSKTKAIITTKAVTAQNTKPAIAVKEGTQQQLKIIQKLSQKQKQVLRTLVAQRLTQPFPPQNTYFWITFGGFRFRFLIPRGLKKKRKRKIRGKKLTKKQVLETYKPSLAEELAGRTTTRQRGLVGFSPRTRVIKRKKPVKRRRKRVIKRRRK